MDVLNKSILELCNDFINIADRLYENHQITQDEYVELTKLKFEFINKMK